MSIDLKQNNIKVDIILSDGFVMTELSGVVDVLRLANRVVDKKMFTFYGWIIYIRRINKCIFHSFLF